MDFETSHLPMVEERVNNLLSSPNAAMYLDRTDLLLLWNGLLLKQLTVAQGGSLKNETPTAPPRPRRGRPQVSSPGEGPPRVNPTESA